VGIGTSSPASLLHLDQGSGGNGLRFERDSYDTMDIELSESGFRIRNETDGRTDLFIDGSGNVGIGTTSPVNKLSLPNNNYIAWKNNAGSSETIAIRANTSDGLEFLTGTTRMTIDSSGNVGIGIGSPTEKLHLYGSNVQALLQGLGTSSTAILGFLPRAADNAAHKQEIAGNSSSLTFSTGGNSGNSYVPTEAMRINSSGNVGIGTTNPAYKLAVSAGGASSIEFGPAYSGTTNLVQHYNRSGAVYVDVVNIAQNHRFNIGGSEAMRIDSSGNLLVGKTTAGLSVNGVEINANDLVYITRDGGTPFYVNRKTSDGTIIDVRKDGTTVGSIGNSGTQLTIDSSSNLVLDANSGTASVITRGRLRPLVDNTDDIGSADRRFIDAHFSGTVNTGDVTSDTVTLDTGASDWQFSVVSNNLIISYGGTAKMKLDTSGNLTVVGDVTAFGSI